MDFRGLHIIQISYIFLYLKMKICSTISLVFSGLKNREGNYPETLGNCACKYTIIYSCSVFVP